jgi:hypothetical protein
MSRTLPPSLPPSFTSLLEKFSKGLKKSSPKEKSPELGPDLPLPDMAGFRDSSSGQEDQEHPPFLPLPDMAGFEPSTEKTGDTKKSHETIDREKLLGEILKNLLSLNVKAVIFDFDLTLLKISSGRYYSTKSSAARKVKSTEDILKPEHTDKETLKRDWFADFDFLKSFLETCRENGIQTAIISDQRTIIISQIIECVGLQDLFQAIIGKNSVLDSKNRRPSVLSKAAELTKEDEFCAYLDDSESNIKRLKNDKTIIPHYVFSDNKDVNKNGLGLSNWNSFNETLKQVKVNRQKTQDTTTPTKPSPDFEPIYRADGKDQPHKRRKLTPPSPG